MKNSIKKKFIDILFEPEDDEEQDLFVEETVKEIKKKEIKEKRESEPAVKAKDILYKKPEKTSAFINLDETKIKVAVDANTNGNTIYLIDYLKLFDWRGPNAGYMWGNQTWFWAYYMVKSITVDMTPANVKTNMHSNTMQPLSTITT